MGHRDLREPGLTVSPDQQSSQDRAAVILTPDQRVRVFISSTLEELAEERAAALRAIRRLHLVPVWYESGARPHPPQSMYRAYLEQSQIFVGIYWQRYGRVGPGMEISGLEDEFRLAAGMPMLLYLKRPAPEQEPGLAAMINSIRAAGTTSYRHFSTARELERLLVDDLAVLLSESFADATISLAAPGASPSPPEELGDSELPSGTLTFLLTDIEGSTRLWEAEPEAMEVALQQHDRLLAEVIENHGGTVIASRGEGTVASRFFTARCRRWRRPAFASCGWGVKCGRRVRRRGCGWGCIPGRCGCAAAITWTTPRSTVVLGCGPPATAGRCCSPRPPATW
jgi:hypothetical protein